MSDPVGVYPLSFSLYHRSLAHRSIRRPRSVYSSNEDVYHDSHLPRDTYRSSLSILISAISNNIEINAHSSVLFTVGICESAVCVRIESRSFAGP